MLNTERDTTKKQSQDLSHLQASISNLEAESRVFGDQRRQLQEAATDAQRKVLTADTGTQAPCINEACVVTRHLHCSANSGIGDVDALVYAQASFHAGSSTATLLPAFQPGRSGARDRARACAQQQLLSISQSATPIDKQQCVSAR